MGRRRRDAFSDVNEVVHEAGSGPDGRGRHSDEALAEKHRPATLTDAGPLIAIIDADERDHEACLTALDDITLPMITTWPAFTEAMYLLSRGGSDRKIPAVR